MVIVIHAGGWWAHWSGLPRPIALAVPAVLVIVFFFLIGRLSRTAASDAE